MTTTTDAQAGERRRALATLALFLFYLALLVGLVLVEVDDFGIAVSAGLTAGAIVLIVITEMWRKHSDAMAIALAGGDERDERRRALGYKARSIAGRACLAWGMVCYIAAATMDADTFARAHLTPADGVQITVAGMLLVYIVARLLAARYYSKRN